MENMSKTAIISLGISLISLALFIALFNIYNDGLLISWIVVSVVAAFFPFYSKYRRMRSGTRGKWLEGIAFAIGILALYMILFFGLGLQSMLLDILILILCLLYWKLFNKVRPKGSDT